MHSSMGAGKLTVYRLGDRDRWEFIVAGQGGFTKGAPTSKALLSRSFSTRFG